MKIFVGNLSPRVLEEKLRALFEEFGEVSKVVIASVRSSSQDRKIGFVEMRSKFHAQAAISLLNGQEMDGRRLVVYRLSPHVESRISVS